MACADSFTVTNYSSSGAGSLSTAIDGLNTSGVAGTIEFNEASASGTIDLSGYTTTLNYDTIFDLNSYDVTLSNYIGGNSGKTTLDGATTGILDIGPGSTWTNTDDLTVGNSGTGVLAVSGGGNLTANFSISVGNNAGSTGSIVVTGTGSTLHSLGYTYIGGSGNGDLSVEDGGYVYCETNCLIGYVIGSVGTATVKGEGSLLKCGSSIHVGFNFLADGTLNILDSGDVDSVHMLIGSGANTTGTVNVAGGILSLADLELGDSGTGTLTVYDDSTVNISGGVIRIANIAGSSGTLNIGNGGAAAAVNATTIIGGAGTATLNFNHNESGYEFAPDLTGSINVNFNGTGTTVLTGATDHTGTTTLNSGTWGVRSNMTTGGDVSLIGGVLDLGMNTLTVGGDYTQAAGSRIDLTVSGSSCGSISVAAGDVTVNGGTLNLRASDYIRNRTVYKVIDAGAGTIAYNAMPSVIDNSAVLSFIASSLDGDLILTARRRPYYTLVSGNAAEAGAALEQVGEDGATGDMLNVLNELDDMPDIGDLQNALDTVTPTVDRGVVDVSNNSMEQFVRASMRRLSMYFDRNRDTGETGVSTGDKGISGTEAWGSGFGEYLKQKHRDISNGYRAVVWGTSLGGDIPAFGEKVRFGLSGGYARSNINSKDNSGSTDIDSYQGAFYGGYIDPDNPYYLNGSFSFAYNKYEGKRYVAVGAITDIADAGYDGQQYSVMLDGGYALNAGRLRVTPLASLQYLRLHLQSYTETGAGVLNLSVRGQDYDMLQSGLGMKLERPYRAKGMMIVPEVHAKWFYDFIGDRQETTSTFSGGSGSFATHGFAPAQNSFNAGARLTLVSHNDWSIETNYDFEYKEDFTAHTGWADIRHKF